MENSKNIVPEEKESNMGDQIATKYLPYWPLFLLFALISLAGAYVYLRYTTPMYQAKATIIIKDGSRGGSEETKISEAIDLMSSKKTIVFDLDDTLVYEIDFLKSAFQEIATFVDSKDENLFDKMLQWYFDKENVFENLKNKYPKIEIQELKNKYRNHFPDFDSNSENRDLLISLKHSGHYLGLITDGFSITQRNKLKALNIENLLDLIIISEEFGSEKPNLNNFETFHQFDTQEYFYIGDNVSKDFITPNKLGWHTICLLDQGKNIHKQNFDLELIYLPEQKIKKLSHFKLFL